MFTVLGSETRDERAASRLFLRRDLRLDRNEQFNFREKAVIEIVGDAERASVDHRFGVRSADLAAVTEVRLTSESINRQIDGQRDAVQREFAFDGGRRPIHEFRELAHVICSGKLRDIEDV